MSTSEKTPKSIRQGGPGSSEQNAKAPLDLRKGEASPDKRTRSQVSGGGGEPDRNHDHHPSRKGGGSHPAH